LRTAEKVSANFWRPPTIESPTSPALVFEWERANVLRDWERAASYDAEKGAALAWMTVVTRRIELNELRRRDNSHDSLDEEEAPEIPAELPEQDPMAKTRLIDCLDKLGEDRRQWVVLAYIHGYSHEELAPRFNRPLGTMKSALFRGLADLRKSIS
jgi:RNA polymerase sigma-70 factor (ECF subfamily)